MGNAIKQNMLIRLYLVDDHVVPKNLAAIGSLDAPPTEQVVLNRLFALNGVFVLLANGQLQRQIVVDDDDNHGSTSTTTTVANNNYQVGDFTLRIDRSYWQDDELNSLQVHPEHVFEQLVVDKYRLRPGANLALVIERLAGDLKPHNFYFEVTTTLSSPSKGSDVLVTMRDHINDDLATFLSTLMLC